MQEECTQRLQEYFNRRATDEMRREFDHLYEENEKKRRLSLQNLFESQLQTSVNETSEATEEEDKESHDINETKVQKFL